MGAGNNIAVISSILKSTSSQRSLLACKNNKTRDSRGGWSCASVRTFTQNVLWPDSQSVETFLNVVALIVVDS